MSALAAEVNLQLNYPQWRAWEAAKPGNTVFLGWGRGVGKSEFLRVIWWSLIANRDGRLRRDALGKLRGIRIVVLMPTLKQFKDVHWARIIEMLTSDWAFLCAKLDAQSGQVKFPGGSFVKPFPASEYNARTALGLRADVLVIDECDDVPAGVYDAVAQPWLSEPWSLGMQLIAGTPNKGRHGLWWRTYQQGLLGEKLRSGAALDPIEGESAEETAARADALKTIFAFRGTYVDTPETVGADKAVKARATMPLATFKREWLADPDAGEGLVYSFDDSFHVREPPPLRSFVEFHVGMDHGSEDPGVLLLAGVLGHGADATLWLLDEWYERDVRNHVWDTRAKAWGHAKFWPDTSRRDRVADLRAMGLDVGEVDRGPGSVLAGIARVADLLFIRQHEDGTRWAKLYVSPKCKNTIHEFGLYRRKKHLDGTFDEEPQDKDNHAMDSLRYLVMGRFGAVPNVRHVAGGR